MKYKKLKEEIEKIKLDYYRKRFSFNQYDDYYITRKIMNALIKREIQIQNFHLFESYFESNDEVIKKVYIQYQYSNNW